jgi:hypothetical protein
MEWFIKTPSCTPGSPAGFEPYDTHGPTPPMRSTE